MYPIFILSNFHKLKTPKEESCHMEKKQDRRKEKRLKFQWPAWFSYDENGEFFHGQIHDLSKTSVSFTIEPNHQPAIGTKIVVRFSYPISDKPFFNMGRYFQWAKVVRVAHNEVTNKNIVAVDLHHPLKQSLPIEYCDSLAMQAT